MRNSRWAWRFIARVILPPPSPKGHKAEKLRPQEQLVHTNLSLFYMKSGDKVTAEKHGLQAKIESWRADAAKAKSTDEKTESASALDNRQTDAAADEISQPALEEES